MAKLERALEYVLQAIGMTSSIPEIQSIGAGILAFLLLRLIASTRWYRRRVPNSPRWMPVAIACAVGGGFLWASVSSDHAVNEAPHQRAETHGDQSPIIQGDNNTIINNPPPEELLRMLLGDERTGWEREFPLGYGVALYDGRRFFFDDSKRSEVKFDWSRFHIVRSDPHGVTYEGLVIDTPKAKGTKLMSITIGPLQIGTEAPAISIGGARIIHRIVLFDGKHIGLLVGAAPTSTP